MQSPKHALALQREFKGALYTPKLPINRTDGHYNIVAAGAVDREFLCI